ncbi:MAG: nicotinate-nucleotide adenylyltransferase [Kangiellaceae bacterium]|nr:nicotinate-nucleotide adenylyltransferase [Kangiellaceae bacterium]MCW8999169.1 nicotinate-nucleotide adenylyltransferase [Kangiellaceae bacterium]MCW9016145.1 nicotinate-nucleotide adenylyltransferase [Kangiellaceae bacterium]
MSPEQKYAQQQLSVEFILGGTFDPVHNGHLAIFKTLRQAAPDATIRVIPCAIPPLKAKARASFEQRVEMLKLALKGQKKWLLDNREQNRQGKSYTVDTLCSLKREQPLTTFVLVMGADSVVDLQQWHHWHKLSELCHLIVFNRPGVKEEQVRHSLNSVNFKLKAQFEDLKESAAGRAFYMKMPEKNESSTEIRDTLINAGTLINGDTVDLSQPQSVIEYIHQNRLYLSQ